MESAVASWDCPRECFVFLLRLCIFLLRKSHKQNLKSFERARVGFILDLVLLPAGTRTDRMFTFFVTLFPNGNHMKDLRRANMREEWQSQSACAVASSGLWHKH